MKVKTQHRIRRTSVIALILFLPCFFLTLFVFVPREGDTPNWVICALSVSFLVSMFSIIFIMDYGRELSFLKEWLGAKDLTTIMDLSDTQMEQLCMQRLKELAEELVEAEKQHPMPMAQERLRTRGNLQRGYSFFVNNGFIKPTPWERFFPKPDAKK